MVVCKYFMEGYCKFGGRCKFDHIDPYRGYDSPRSGDYSSERPQGTSILKAATSSFGGQEYSHSPQQAYVQPQQHGFSQNFSQTPPHSFSQPPQHSFSQTPQHGFSTPQQSSFIQKPSGLKYNVQEIMQIVVRDMAQLEKGGQWQLSCYSPLKELPNVPGLDDYSPEELRWECYKALQNGSLPLCQVIVQQLFANVAKINNELKRKDTGYSIIDRWLRDSEQRAAQNTVEQPPSAFASPLRSSSGTTSAFSSPFFTNDPQTQQPQPQPQSAASSFSFSLSPQQPPSNANPFQQSTGFSSNQTSAFAPSGQTSVFATSNQPSAFVSGNQTSPFDSRNQPSPFAPSNQTSPFVSSDQTSPFTSSNQTSPFASQGTSSFSSPLRAQAIDSRVYSSDETLSEAELKAFQADRFVLGSIPTKPPPRALCNL